jgi:hypothetical protein
MFDAKVSAIALSASKTFKPRAAKQRCATLLEQQRCWSKSVALALRNASGAAALVQHCATLLEQQRC